MEDDSHDGHLVEDLKSQLTTHGCGGGNEDHDFHSEHHSDSFELLAYARFVRFARPLAYSNEFGEAFRHTFPKILKPMYAISFGYIAADIGVAVAEADPKDRAITLLDQTIWHSIASLVVPGVTVHKTVKVTTKLVKNAANIHVKRILPVAIGLGIIPLIVHPIDHYTDVFMDHTVRKLY